MMKEHRFDDASRLTPVERPIRARSGEVTVPRLDDADLDGLLPGPGAGDGDDEELDEPTGRISLHPAPLPAPPDPLGTPAEPLGDLDILVPLDESMTAIGVGLLRIESRPGGVEAAELSARPHAEDETRLARPASPEAAAPQNQDVGDKIETRTWEFSDPDLSQPGRRADPTLVAGRYRILGELGKGGMSRLFRVSHVGMGREFALKIILADLAEDPKIKKHFVREAQVLSQLEHPNIVQITDFGVDEVLGAFIVMEYLRGETLLGRLRRKGPMPPSQALDIALQVAEALNYIHGRELVHCDIKAENVLLCPPPSGQRQRPVAKLIDFGLSRTKALDAQLSRSEVGGTPQYMAPEQIRGQAPRPSMDIYALGILLFEMLTGTLPFKGEVPEILLGHVGAPAPTLSSVLPVPVDDALEALVRRALAKDPGERQATMGHFIFELRTVMDMLGLGRNRGVMSVPSLDRVPSPVAPHIHCQLCPFPMFRLDITGRIVMANPAFARFVKQDVETLYEAPIAQTRLALIWPDVSAEIADAQREGRLVQRVLRFKPRGQSTVSVMATLVSERSADQGAQSITGIIVPLDEANFSCVEEE